MNDSMDALQSQFRQLRLVETASELPELLRKSEQASWTYRELVQEIVRFELRKREEKSVQKRLKWAKFPYHKTLTEFDLSDQTSLSKRQLTQLQELTWLEQLITASKMYHLCNIFYQARQRNVPVSAKQFTTNTSCIM